MESQLIMIIGPMYSGKSTSLINYYNIYSLKHKCIVINHSSDTRYTDNGFVCSHNKNKIKSYSFNTISKIKSLEEYEKSEVILIDEGQFFPDLVEEVLNIVNKDKKTVIISGLSGDYKKQPFENINRLLSEADEKELKKSICSLCDTMTPAIFTKKIINEEGENKISIGGLEKYIPVCRKHY